MRITVLGSSPSWPNPGGACSGYLAREGDTCLLLDCGPGTLGRLRQQVEIGHLSGILISHMHADHFMDLVPLRYGLRFGNLAGAARLRVFVPPGGSGFLRGLGRALDGNASFFGDTYDLQEYEPAAPLKLGQVTVSFRRVKHYIPAYAMRLEAEQTLTYSGDAAPCPELVEHARGASTLLCEAAIRGPADDRPDPAQRGHMSAGEAGQLAHEASVQQLILTHYRLNPDDPERIVEEAKRSFDGRVARAVEGETYQV